MIIVTVPHYVMNALECRTLTATSMHDSCVCIHSMAHCMCMLKLFNIRSIELHTLHLNMVMVGWCCYLQSQCMI